MNKVKLITAIALIGAMLTGCAEKPAEETTVTETASQTEETTAAETTAETTAEATVATTETTPPETEATTAETEFVPEFENEEAERFYSIIMADTGWKHDNIKGATILDLQGDGTPEFVADNHNESRLEVYAFGEEKLEFLYDFEKFNWNMVRYTGNGKTQWWGEIYDFTESDKDSSYKTIGKYGFYEFTDEGPVMTEVLFNETTEYDEETDIYYGIMYKFGEYYAEDRIEEYSKLDGMPDLAHFGWYIDKADWEGANLSDEENYVTSPNSIDLSTTENAERDIEKLVNAYVTNDKSYLTEPGGFGEVNAFKPIIYLYPEEKTDVTVELNVNGRLTCTYPEYDSRWQVTAFPDGTIYDKRDGTEYYSLFWEADLKADWDMSKGFVVEREDTADFLREKLAEMGLTPRESNEFIIYWLPLMQENECNLITFQTEQYEQNAVLDIDPVPDSLLRIFMVYEECDPDTEIAPQEFEPFERNGFTVVEWGGSRIE